MSGASLALELRSYNSETRAHTHDYHQLVLPVSGRMPMQVGGRGGEVNADRLALISAGREHEFAAAAGNRFVVADIPEALAPEFERLPPFIDLDPSLAQYVVFLYQQLIDDTRSSASERQMLLLLIQLLKERFGRAVKIDQRIQAVQSHLDRCYAEQISLPRLAAIANLSVRQLNHVFRAALGMTPHQYLVETRMRQAWQLLSESDLQIGQVANRVGYGNQAAFSDRFRRHFGHSPRYFRRNAK